MAWKDCFCGYRLDCQNEQTINTKNYDKCKSTKMVYFNENTISQQMINKAQSPLTSEDHRCVTQIWTAGWPVKHRDPQSRLPKPFLRRQTAVHMFLYCSSAAPPHWCSCSALRLLMLMYQLYYILVAIFLFQGVYPRAWITESRCKRRASKNVLEKSGPKWEACIYLHYQQKQKHLLCAK